jgi:hypothetical protein
MGRSERIAGEATNRDPKNLKTTGHHKQALHKPQDKSVVRRLAQDADDIMQIGARGADFCITLPTVI